MSDLENPDETNITITADYTCSFYGTADLAPYTWDDVHSWFVKWDMFHVVFKDGESKACELYSECNLDDCVDWKHPTDLVIFEGEMEYENQLDSD